MHRKFMLAAAAATVVSSSAALGQSVAPAVFVVNNVGDNITSFTVDPASGQLTLVNSFPTIEGPQAVAVSPDGQYVAVSHGTISQTFEALEIFQVNPDATLTNVGTTFVPDSPLDVKWVSKDTVAVTHTGGPMVRTYRFDGGSFTQVGSAPAGGFNSRLAFHAPTNTLYAQDTTSDSVFAMRVNGDGSLTPIDTEPTPPGMVNIGVSPGGERLIGATGALSGSDREIWSFPLDGTGAVGPGPGTFINSPEVFPDGIAFSPDGRLVFVGHNGDEVTASFHLDLATGALTATGHSFTVGDTLSQGELATLGDLLFVLDESSIGDSFQGIYTLRYDAGGMMTVVDQDVTGGPRPMDLAVWQGIPEPSMLGLVSVAGLLLGRRKR